MSVNVTQCQKTLRNARKCRKMSGNVLYCVSWPFRFLSRNQRRNRGHASVHRSWNPMFVRQTAYHWATLTVRLQSQSKLYYEHCWHCYRKCFGAGSNPRRGTTDRRCTILSVAPGPRETHLLNLPSPRLASHRIVSFYIYRRTDAKCGTYIPHSHWLLRLWHLIDHDQFIVLS